MKIYSHMHQELAAHSYGTVVEVDSSAYHLLRQYNNLILWRMSEDWQRRYWQILSPSKGHHGWRNCVDGVHLYAGTDSFVEWLSWLHQGGGWWQVMLFFCFFYLPSLNLKSCKESSLQAVREREREQLLCVHDNLGIAQCWPTDSTNLFCSSAALC